MVALLVTLILTMGYTGTSSAQTTNTVVPQSEQWKRAESGKWPGKIDGTTYWYRTRNGKLVSTTDNKNWSPVKDNRWMGYDGKWYEMTANDVLWSSDGELWTSTGDRVWRGSDGNWYMFDNNWVLWTGGNGTLPPSTVNKK